MMIFWMISALLLLVALLFVVVPLWRGGLKKNEVKRDAANLEIFRDQIAEMDADLRNGLLTQEMYEQGKQELQSRLLDDVQQGQDKNTASVANPFKILAAVLIILLPLAVIGVYWKVGNQQALLQQDNHHADSFAGVASAPALKALEEHLKSNPDDAENWLLVARTYGEMERFADAAQAYDKLTKLVPGEAEFWVDYADVLAMASGKTLLGKPTKLLDKALALEPENFKALALSGSAAMERGAFADAVRYWEKLLKRIPKDNENAKIVEAGIQHARVLMAQNSGVKSATKNKSNATEKQATIVKAGRESISGTVILSEAIKSRTNPDDTVFVLVRASEGSKMPLAIIRKQVRDLPFAFVLDDSTAMSPETRLSNFEQVIVIARVSKSGAAMTQTGDLQGMSAIIKPGSKNIKLLIDKIVP